MMVDVFSEFKNANTAGEMPTGIFLVAPAAGLTTGVVTGATLFGSLDTMVIPPKIVPLSFIEAIKRVACPVIPLASNSTQPPSALACSRMV